MAITQDLRNVLLTLPHRYAMSQGVVLRIAQPGDLRGPSVTADQLQIDLFDVRDTFPLPETERAAAAAYATRTQDQIEREIPDLLRPFEPFSGFIARVGWDGKGRPAILKLEGR